MGGELFGNKTLFARTSVDELLWERHFSGIKKRQPFGFQALCISLFEHSRASSYERIMPLESFLVRLYFQRLVKTEQEIILRNWLMEQNDEGAPPEVVN